MNQPFTLFDASYRALVMGANGAIGSAFVKWLQNHPQCSAVHTLSRSQGLGFDLQSEASIKRASLELSAFAPFDLVIDATGVLSVDNTGPEKALSALNADRMKEVFHLNTIGPALLIKHFAPLLSSGPAIYAKLSARVGSISDNQKGGWYSYRASKAALNMVLQTAAIELQRKNPQLQMVALQPGTVRSHLSAPFTSGLSSLLEPEQSVAGLMKTLQTLQSKPGAQFLDHQGLPIPW